jgi:hypothetical protein
MTRKPEDPGAGDHPPQAEDEFSEKTKPYTNYMQAVKEDIAFCQGTGYDREKTAVVPLAELARREEDRLRRQEQGERDFEEASEQERRRSVIPIGEIVDVLRATASVEEVAGVLVELMSNMIPRVLLLWERRGVLYGFASSGMGLSEVKLLTIEVPRRVMWEMAGVAFDLDTYKGPPQMIGQVPRFFEIIGGTPPEILLVPVQVTANDRWVLFADAGDAPLPPVEPRLVEVIASRAGARADLLMEGHFW